MSRIATAKKVCFWFFSRHLDEKDEKLKGKAPGGVYSKILESSEVSDLWNENEYCQEFV